MNRILLGLLLSLVPAIAGAQNQDYPGYIGVYVYEGNGGMQIDGFIRGTPAQALANNGEISRGDTIVELADRRTTTLAELHRARNSFGLDEEAMMVLRDRRGNHYHVWVSRNPATAKAEARADSIRYGGAGKGDGEKVRRKQGGDDAGDDAPQEGPKVRPKTK